MVVLADDGTGENLSQSVMVVRAAYDKGDGAKTLDAVKRVWDEAAAEINARPEAYRSLLVEKANLNEKVAGTYPISSYPFALDANGNALFPAADLIEPQIAWMKAKGYSTKNVSYDESTGSIRVS